MAAEYSNLEKTRLEKINNLRSQGIDPYPNRAERTHTNAQAKEIYEAAEGKDEAEVLSATLVGRLRSMRPMGKITFAHIEDGSGRIQVGLPVGRSR